MGGAADLMESERNEGRVVFDQFDAALQLDAGQVPRDGAGLGSWMSVRAKPWPRACAATASLPR